ncbi:hypothetical protein [Dyella caseinilytica]|uniref:Uncharacterized protein n=1 Tax=Dyella caseinilytica TaxID=1849581 RepID=A0ABX7GPZ3_9GAMM|nr:hypothetical protein [Dyella caseinilytica]QRN52320.1 hypothetical protein ISN74_12585 [Dyella caseinilytica]GGA14811.1 hypothetical protein GCM10011408_40890 [Dyella caseinilytica]
MSTFPAIVSEGENGPYYKVKLAALPGKGDRIRLTSFVDTANHHDALHLYEVQGVMHELHDVPDDDPRHANGYHAIQILVKRLR